MNFMLFWDFSPKEKGNVTHLPLVIRFFFHTFFVVIVPEKIFCDLRGPIGPLKSKSPSIGWSHSLDKSDRLSSLHRQRYQNVQINSDKLLRSFQIVKIHVVVRWFYFWEHKRNSGNPLGTLWIKFQLQNIIFCQLSQ